ncbi:hypothetical protein [Caldicellulosiruptor acetigenus]|uniref:hypothetical protein n=1 Tax=Caldicellulosiruptor acetigenus TaxID=301953 RepID=UPI001E37AC92|nr:hypothetical protein [Caldicellulosiruptor acetigenus]
MKIKLIIGGNNLNPIGEVENRKELHYFTSHLFSSQKRYSFLERARILYLIPCPPVFKKAAGLLSIILSISYVFPSSQRSSIPNGSVKSVYSE